MALIEIGKDDALVMPETGISSAAQGKRRLSALAGLRSGDRVASLILTVGIGLLMLVCATLISGWIGAIFALVMVAVFAVLALRLPANVTMRLYRAVPLDPVHSDKLHRILGMLADRAGLAAAPRLFIIPSLTVNAFAAGRDGDAAIAVTEGLLRRLTLREITGVLGHEISHVRNGDLAIMTLADVMTRTTQLLAWLGIALLLLQIPAFLLGREGVPWLAIALLCLAPALGNVLQLALSRTREYDADVGAVMLTGDALGLASALSRIDQTEGRVIEDVLPPYGRRVSHPSLLRSHPSSDERIVRLKELAERGDLPTFTTREEPMVSLAGLGPISMRARYRFPGIWF